MFATGWVRLGKYMDPLRDYVHDLWNQYPDTGNAKGHPNIRSDTPSSDKWIPNQAVLLLSYISLCAFYAVTICYNHAENLDGLQYAFAAEKASLTYIWDSRAFLFQFINRVIFLATDELGLTTRSFLPLVGFTILISSASVLLMARLLIKGFGVSPLAGWTGAAMLGLSYGFWRYASAVEVYNGSVFLILVVANLLMCASRRPQSRWIYLSIASVVSGVATLYYQPNAIILFIAASAYILRTASITGLMLYGSVGSLVVLLGYLSAYAISESEFPSIPLLLNFVMSRNEELSSSGLDLRLILKSVHYAIKSFWSINWVFSVEYLDRIMDELSPRRDHTALKIAVIAFKPIVYVSFFTAAVLILSLIFMLRKSIQSRHFVKLDSKLLLVAGVIMLYVPLLLAHGKHFEVWIVLLPFFIVLFSIFLFDTSVRSGRRSLPVIFVAILGIHNYVGGVGPLQSPKDDHVRKAISWIERSASGDDTVVIFRNRISHIVLRNYLLYYGGVNVLTIEPGAALLVPSASYELQWRSFERHVRDIGSSNGRVLVFESFFRPDERIRNFAGGGSHYDYYRSLGEVFFGSARLLHEDQAGKIYSVRMDEEIAERVASISAMP